MGEFDDILGPDKEEIGLFEVDENGDWKSPIARKMVDDANDRYLQEKFKERVKQEAEKDHLGDTFPSTEWKTALRKILQGRNK